MKTVFFVLTATTLCFSCVQRNFDSDSKGVEDVDKATERQRAEWIKNEKQYRETCQKIFQEKTKCLVVTSAHDSNLKVKFQYELTSTSNLPFDMVKDKVNTVWTWKTKIIPPATKETVDTKLTVTEDFLENARVVTAMKSSLNGAQCSFGVFNADFPASAYRHFSTDKGYYYAPSGAGLVFLTEVTVDEKNQATYSYKYDSKKLIKSCD